MTYSIIMKLIIILIIIMAAGCGRSPERVYSVQPEFESYVKDFQADAVTYGKKEISLDAGLIVEMKEISYAGLCHLTPHKPPHVEIDTLTWAHATSIERKMLMYHELGHCLLGRGHNEVQRLEGGEHIQISIMFHSHVAEARFLKYKEALLTELFLEK
jgi:hypothetical protein